jgi:hypothetical protein
MLAELEWWFYVFILPELVIAAIGLIALLIGAIGSASDRR